MRRLWWWCGAAGGTVLVVAGGLLALDFPDRSTFTSDAQPDVCALLTAASSPYGPVTSCLTLGRRTPLFGSPDGTVFVLLETETGPASLRVDYRNTDAGRQYTAEAVEIPTWQTPGISADTVKRIQPAVEGRGGLHSEPWVIHPSAG